MPRPSLTLILLTRQDLVRADFAPGSPPKLLGLWGQPRPDLPDVSAQVEAALMVGPKPGRDVWVLSTDLWTQSIAMPSGRSTGLSNDELAAALNFEAEALSGQAALESTIAFTPQQSGGTEKNYWIAQARTTDLEFVDDVVRKAGARLAGFAHPAGVPVPVAASSAAGATWRRAELWADVVVFVQGRKHEPSQVDVINSAPQVGQWQAAWEQRRGQAVSAGHEELLVDVGVTAAPANANQLLVRLDDDAALRSWLKAWAEAIGGKNLAMPVMRPAKRPMTVGQRRAVAAVLALVAAAACIGHFTWADQAINDTQADIKAALEPGQRLAEYQKRVKELEPKLVDLRKQHDKVDLQFGLLQLQRQRLARLLTSLSEQRPEHLVVQRIEADGCEPRLVGICWQADLADQFASKLSRVLPDAGWKVEAPKKKVKDLVPGGGPCEFAIQLRAVANPALAPMFTANPADAKAKP